jgi:hypothetical protein
VYIIFEALDSELQLVRLSLENSTLGPFGFKLFCVLDELVVAFHLGKITAFANFGQF